MAAAFVVVNGALPEAAGDEPLAAALRKREAAAIATMAPELAALPHDAIPLKIRNVMGLPALRDFFDAHDVPGPDVAPAAEADRLDAPLVDLIDAIEADGHGLVLCMGKGGVGKTTIAAAIAVALAHRGHDVLLTTTDPAAHLARTLQDSVERLTVSRIDPVAALQDYRDRVMATKGRDLDEAGRAALAEDLMSPCTEEVAVFQQFSRAVHESRRRFVVIDTAPTGHMLLLLDAAGSYHREITRQMGDSAQRFITPLMRLQDPRQTKILLVTLPEPTPVLEAGELRDDLERADIRPWAWVINNSVAAAHPQSPFLDARARAEGDQIARVRSMAPRLAIVPLLAEEPSASPGCRP